MKTFSQIALIAFTVVLAPALAMASLQVSVSSDNTTFTTLTMVDNGFGNYTYANSALSIGGINFDVSLNVTTNSPGTPTLAELLTVQATVRQRGAGGGNRDVYLLVVDDSFTQPVGSDLVLNSELVHVSQTQGGPGARQLTSTFVGDITETLGPHSYGSFASDEFTSSGTPFTLSSLTYVHLTPNEGVGIEARTWLTSAGTVVPEPGTIAVWGLLAITGYFGVKKYQAKA